MPPSLSSIHHRVCRNEECEPPVIISIGCPTSQAETDKAIYYQSIIHIVRRRQFLSRRRSFVVVTYLTETNLRIQSWRLSSPRWSQTPPLTRVVIMFSLPTAASSSTLRKNPRWRGLRSHFTCSRGGIITPPTHATFHGNIQCSAKESIRCENSNVLNIDAFSTALGPRH